MALTSTEKSRIRRAEMAKLTKFGTIKEDENGNLELDGFGFDGEHEDMLTADALLGLIIDRLNHHRMPGNGLIDS